MNTAVQNVPDVRSESIKNPEKAYRLLVLGPLLQTASYLLAQVPVHVLPLCATWLQGLAPQSVLECGPCYRYR